MTSNGLQSISTINNLNMEGEFNNESVRQFKNLNTAEINFINSNLNNATPETDKNIKIYDGIFKELDTFTPSGAIQEPTDFIQNSLITVDGLFNTLNTLYKCKIYYDSSFESDSDTTKKITIKYNNNNNIGIIEFPINFGPSNDDPLDADTTASSLAITINNTSYLSAKLDLINKVIIVSTRSNINLTLDNESEQYVNNTNIPSLRIENYEKVFNVLPTDINNIASTLFTAEIVYNDNLFTSTNDHSIELYYDGGSIIFNMITSGIPTSTQFLQESNVDTTAINLNNTINDYTDSNSNTIFSAEIDTVNKKITVRTTSNNDISLVNNIITGDGFTSITNFTRELSKTALAELEFNNNIATSINEHSVELYYDETNSVTFNMITSGTPSSTEFLQIPSSVFSTSMKLKNTINNYTDSNSNTIFSAIIDSKQNALTFGRNNYGQLGLGDNTNRNTPTQIQGYEDIIAVSCGMYHTAIVKSDGTVYTFGLNTYGQLGLGNTTDKNIPTKIENLEYTLNGTTTTISATDIIEVFCGGSYTAILKLDGTVYTFGLNSTGQLGLGDTTNKNIPTKIENLEYTLNGTTTTIPATNIIAVSCGDIHTAILKSDGTVYTFGRNNEGQLGLGDTTQRNTPTQIQGHEDIIEVSCGLYHTAIVKSNGTVYTFGRNNDGQLGLGDSGSGTERTTPTQIQGFEDIIAVSCGDYHTAILKNDGTVYTFGWNYYGQLGLGNSGSGTDRTTPTQIQTHSDIIAVSCRRGNTAILKSDRTLYTFGDNTYGQLGDGSTTRRDTPVPVVDNNNISVDNIATVSCGHYSTVIIQGIIDNKITIKRNIDSFNINLNSIENTITGEGFTSITNFNHFIPRKIILTQETSNEYYNNSSLFDSDELGISDFTILEGTGADFPHNAAIPNGTIGTYQIINKFIECLSSIKRKVLDRYKIFQEKIQENKINKIYTFGINSTGQLGLGDYDNRNTPTQIQGHEDVIAVSCGRTNTLILKSNGTVFYSGSLFGSATLFTEIVHDNAKNIIAISSGINHVALLKSNGNVYTMGYNTSGQLGDGSNTNSISSPVPVVDINGDIVEDIIAVSCGKYYTAILKSNGTVYTFGRNTYGQLGDGSYTNSNTPVPVVDINGDIVEDIIAVSCGGEHTAIVKSNGTVYTFGRNNVKQLGIGEEYYPNITSRSTIPLQVLEYIITEENGDGYSETAKDVIAVSCGDRHTLILKSDGTVFSFGNNTTFELGLGITNSFYEEYAKFIAGISDIIDISAGYSFSAILKSDGTVYTFGNNGYGQLGIGDVPGVSRTTPTHIETHTDIIAVSCGHNYAAIIKQELDIPVSTHQSSIILDQSRGNLNSITTISDSKPFIYKSDINDTIKYSEDALFTLLKGIGYEVFKFKSGITGNNNGVGYTKAGLGNIPISIVSHNNNESYSTYKNVLATIENINKISNSIDINAPTSEDSIPRDTVGLIELINRIIKETNKIKKNIKNNEVDILNNLRINNQTPASVPATFESKFEILKKRGNLVYRESEINNKPSIYTINNDGYSEDAVFSLFSCLTFELMKLINGKQAKNNEGTEDYAGLAVIPACIEEIL